MILCGTAIGAFILQELRAAVTELRPAVPTRAFPKLFLRISRRIQIWSGIGYGEETRGLKLDAGFVDYVISRIIQSVSSIF